MVARNGSAAAASRSILENRRAVHNSVVFFLSNSFLLICSASISLHAYLSPVLCGVRLLLLMVVRYIFCFLGMVGFYFLSII